MFLLFEAVIIICFMTNTPVRTHAAHTDCNSLAAQGNTAMEQSGYRLAADKSLEAFECYTASPGYAATGQELAALETAVTAMMRMGLDEKAAEYARKGLDVVEEKYGEKHLAAVSFLMNIAGISRRMSDYETSRRSLDSALKILMANFYDDDVPPLIAEMYCNLAQTHIMTGEPGRALDYYRKAIDLREKLFPAGHPVFIKNKFNLASVLIETGDYASAREMLSEALDLIYGNFGEDREEIAAVYEKLGMIEYETGNYEKAMRHYGEAISMLLELHGGDPDPGVAGMCRRAGMLYAEAGHPEKALDHITRAHDIYLELYGEEHPDFSATLVDLGRIHYMYGNVEAALDFYRAAERNYRDSGDLQTSSLARLYEGLAEIFSPGVDAEKASGYYDDALEAIEKTNAGAVEKSGIYSGAGLHDISLGSRKRGLDRIEHAVSLLSGRPGFELQAAGTHLTAGDAYMEIGNSGAAEKNYISALKLAGESGVFTGNQRAVIYHRLGDLRLAEGKWQSAFDNYGRVAELGGAGVAKDMYMQAAIEAGRAEAMYGAGDYAAAAGFASSTLALLCGESGAGLYSNCMNPRLAAEMISLMARIQVRSGDYDRTFYLFKNALSLIESSIDYEYIFTKLPEEEKKIKRAYIDVMEQAFRVYRETGDSSWMEKASEVALRGLKMTAGGARKKEAARRLPEDVYRKAALTAGRLRSARLSLETPVRDIQPGDPLKHRIRYTVYFNAKKKARAIKQFLDEYHPGLSDRGAPAGCSKGSAEDKSTKSNSAFYLLYGGDEVTWNVIIAGAGASVARYPFAGIRAALADTGPEYTVLILDEDRDAIVSAVPREVFAGSIPAGFCEADGIVFYKDIEEFALPFGVPGSAEELKRYCGEGGGRIIDNGIDSVAGMCW